MTYSLLFYETEQEFVQREGADSEEYWGAWSAYIDLLDESGVMVKGAGSGLQAPATATTVRLQSGKKSIQDGPIVDTREQLGGLVLIDVPALDDAIEWAAKAPCASIGVEIRPLLPGSTG